MWLDNTAEEVKCFHPVCKEALEAALLKMNLADRYEVQHHRRVGKIEMDLVIANRKSNKILCVVEVKRTISAVNSTRYQYQAMSYVQSLRDAELESRYYLLTNLESSCLFRFDPARQEVYEQIVEPGISLNHRFADVSKKQFMSDLVSQYVAYIETILNDSGKYLLSFKKFADEIHDRLDEELEWKKALVGLFYEYIRGSFTKVNRGGMRTITQLSNKLDLICREGLRVNFKDIFTLPKLSPKETKLTTNHTLLEQLFELGKTYVDADELANVMHKVISEENKHEGEVATDTELAILMLHLVKHIAGELPSDELIMDPAAGSGSLLCAAVGVFDGIKPSQFIANDINEKLLQLLSLRIGLKFVQSVDRNNTARILTKSIADLALAEFEHVRIIVMNPPYLAATAAQCAKRKAELYRRIKQIKGKNAITDSGQMPLEGPFVELVSVLAKEGTVIAAILPNSHLTTKGEASKAIRQMLLEDFGLQLIFNYPQERLFEGVAQNTSIVIGVKGSPAESVRYLYCNEVVSEVGASTIDSVLRAELSRQGLANVNNQFEGCLLARKKLTEGIKSGWQIGNLTKSDALAFIQSSIATSKYLVRLRDSEYSDYFRGKIGNDGCTDLMYIGKKNPILTDYPEIRKHLVPGINRVKYNKVHVHESVNDFFDVSGLSDEHIWQIVRKFYRCYRKESKQQYLKPKTEQDYFDKLKKEKDFVTPANCVLLPRAIRAEGRVFVTDIPLRVSTNLFVIQADEERSKLLASWFSTIFYQLECEANGNNRKGLRKMEKDDYEPLHVPVTDELSNEQKQRVVSTPITEFLDLRSPYPRDVDRVWADILFGEKADELLEEAMTLVPILVADREK